MQVDLGRGESYLDETVDAIKKIDQRMLSEMASIVADLGASGGTLWTIGNGGSASTGAHLACDVGKGVSTNCEVPIRSICINEQMVSQSAWANDFGFDDALLNQLKVLARPGDAILAISGSGSSKNIVNAVAWGIRERLKVMSMTGLSGGALRGLDHLQIRVQSDDMQVIENVHLVIVHWLYKVLSK